MEKLNLKIKWSLIWILIHLISLFFMGFILNHLMIGSSLINLSIMGFGVMTLASLVNVYRHKTQFIINKWFVFYALITSVIILMTQKLLEVLNITNYLITIILTASSIHLIIHYGIKKLRIRRNAYWTSLIILSLLLYLSQTSNLQSMVYSTPQNTAMNTGTILDSVQNILPATISKGCPQINVPLKKVEGLSPVMDVREFEGWKIAPYDTNTLLGFGVGHVSCHKGNRKGQNMNYWYCGDQSSQTTMAFMQKTSINPDGSIGNTIKQSFVNIYTPVELPREVKELCKLNGGTGVISNNAEEFNCGEVQYEFKETICGEDPEKITDREWDEFKNAIRDFLE